jgi:hypothetical protein
MYNTSGWQTLKLGSVFGFRVIFGFLALQKWQQSAVFKRRQQYKDRDINKLINYEWFVNILLTSLRDFPIVSFSMKH